jgi:DNA-binding transcriptional LysR family regulator
MELRHLRYFIAVAEAENVSRAALKLHVSQPGLSRQVRDLEDELGFPLLERSGKSVRLTDAGRVFLSEAKSVMQRAEEAVQAARAVATGKRGEIQVGYAPSLTVQILPPILRAFQQEMPGVRVVLHDLRCWCARHPRCCAVSIFSNSRATACALLWRRNIRSPR